MYLLITIHQAFIVGERVLGMQFHLETTQASAQGLIEHCPDDLGPGRWVQSRHDILAKPERFERINAVMDTVLMQLKELTV